MAENDKKDPIDEINLNSFNEKKRQQDQAKAEKDHQRRMAAQTELFKKFRIPSEEQKVGGMVGKFIHLAELQAESLAGMAMMEYMMFIVSILVCKTHRENQALYEMAKENGFAYDPAKHTIYKRKQDGSLDFDAPYSANEKIPAAEIYANGFIPEPDIMRSFQLEFFNFMQVQGGTSILPPDVLTELYGADKAEKLSQQNNGGSPKGISREDQIMAGGSKPKP